MVAGTSGVGGVIGIIVIGRNEGERLIRCLASLPMNGNVIVYVDSGSTDGSCEAATAADACVVSLDLSTPFTAARARNAGIAALQDKQWPIDYVQFIDGDCELDRQWLDTARTFLEKNARVAVVCGRRRERFPERSIYNAMCDAEWNTPVGEASACGGDALMRFGPLVEANGYDVALLAGEEPELCARLRALGWKIWRIDAPMTMHDAALTDFRQWWRRAIRGGFGYAQVWTTMKGRSGRLYGRQLMRALLWGGALPLAILAIALMWWPAAVAIALIYPVQVVRLALRGASWSSAVLTMLAKFAELVGVVRFSLAHAAGRYSAPPSYK